MSSDHKRPLYAFAGVALLCALVVLSGLRSDALVGFLRQVPVATGLVIQAERDSQASAAPEKKAHPAEQPGAALRRDDAPVNAPALLDRAGARSTNTPEARPRPTPLRPDHSASQVSGARPPRGGVPSTPGVQPVPAPRTDVGRRTDARPSGHSTPRLRPTLLRVDRFEPTAHRAPVPQKRESPTHRHAGRGAGPAEKTLHRSLERPSDVAHQHPRADQRATSSRVTGPVRRTAQKVGSSVRAVRGNTGHADAEPKKADRKSAAPTRSHRGTTTPRKGPSTSSRERVPALAPRHTEALASRGVVETSHQRRAHRLRPSSTGSNPEPLSNEHDAGRDPGPSTDHVSDRSGRQTPGRGADREQHRGR